MGLPLSTVSQLLGYISIACWLCAQFPQVVKNYNLKSCEGLSLPFLVTWLFGDLGNLVGCILTEQLPFQTYLATYFCLVDLSLLFQFFYYRAKFTVFHPGSLPSRDSHIYIPTGMSQSLILPSASTSPHLAAARGNSVEDRPSRPRRHLRTYTEPHLHRHDGQLVTTPISDEHEAAIYAATLDVARAAERATKTRSRSRRRARTTAPEGSPRNMMESFHSERSVRTSSTVESPQAIGSTLSLYDHRGRNMGRTAVVTGGPPTPLTEESGHETEVPRDNSRSLSVVRGSQDRGRGRRKAGVAFMAVGMMLTWGQWSASDRSRLQGEVIPASTGTIQPSWYPSLSLPSTRHTSSFPSTTLVKTLDDPNHPTSPPHPETPAASFQRIVGRVSAWACTTLYLTSRLPQIWKNFMRRSVEGLSMFLFVFAFLGNTFYVLSIVFNPSAMTDPDANHYLLEALPYLLGSGGTLVFDLTIMIQSLVYGSAPPMNKDPYERSRRIRTRRGKTWHAEDNVGIGASGSACPERQPLLSNSVPALETRNRSLSPGTSLRQHHSRQSRHSSLEQDRS